MAELRRVPPASQAVAAQDLRALLEAPLRRPLLVVIPFVVCVVAALATSFLMPKKYRSSTLILVDSDKIPDSFVPQAPGDESRKRLYTLNQEILSRTRLEKVINELDPYPAVRNKEPLGQTVERMREAIAINTKGDDAFTVEYVHTDPHIAQKVTNRLTTLFIEEGAQRREDQVEGVSRFIETQLEEARKELEAREAALGKFKQEHMGTLPQQLDTNLSALGRLQLEQQSVSENIRAAQDRLAMLATQGPAATAGSTTSAELRVLKGQLGELRGRYTDEHPDVRNLAARIASLEKALDAGTLPGGAADLTDDVRREIQSLMAKREEINRRIGALQGRVEGAPRTEQELATLTRDYQKLNENYLALLNKKLDAQMAEKLEKQWKGERFKVLDPASFPEQPFFPNKPLFLVAGAVAGLCLGFGLALGADFLDHSIRTAAEIERLFAQPVLATIGHISVPRGLTATAARASGPGKETR
jgi:polysaccharide biosynthesis transport protein